MHVGTDRIKLSGLRGRGLHGVYPRERVEGQTFVVDAVLEVDARAAAEMGLVNAVVPLADLERETVRWCREMLALSPFALRLMKASFHAAEDGMAGIQQLAHDANMLFYSTEEAREGREAFKAKRRPEFERFPRRP